MSSVVIPGGGREWGGARLFFCDAAAQRHTTAGNYFVAMPLRHKEGFKAGLGWLFCYHAAAPLRHGRGLMGGYIIPNRSICVAVF